MCNLKKYSIRVLSVLIIMSVVLYSFIAFAALKTQWLSNPCIPELFPEITQMIIQPDKILRIDNHYINPKTIATVSVTSEKTVKVITVNNREFTVAFESRGLTIEFLNTVLNLIQ